MGGCHVWRCHLMSQIMWINISAGITNDTALICRQCATQTLFFNMLQLPHLEKWMTIGGSGGARISHTVAWCAPDEYLICANNTSPLSIHFSFRLVGPGPMPNAQDVQFLSLSTEDTNQDDIWVVDNKMDDSWNHYTMLQHKKFNDHSGCTALLHNFCIPMKQCDEGSWLGELSQCAASLRRLGGGANIDCSGCWHSR